MNILTCAAASFLAILLGLQTAAAQAGDISEAGKRLAEKLDSFEVEKHWPAGQHINWETGVPTGVPEKPRASIRTAVRSLRQQPSN